MARPSFLVAFLVAFLADLLALAALAHGGSAQGSRLNGPLAQPGANDVTDYAASLDGAWVVFRADAEADHVFELYAVPSDGSAAPARLNAALAPNGDVASFVLGVSRAVYLADQDTDERPEIFSVPLDASAAPVKLNLALPPFGYATRLWLTPDGANVLFGIWEPSASLERLYRAPIDGSAPAALIADSGVPRPPYFGGTQISALAFTSNPERAVYTSQTYDDEYDPTRLLQVRVDGSQTQVDLSIPSDTSSVGAFAVSQDGSRVAYVEGIGTSSELYAIQIDGTQRVQLNPPGTLATSFGITPDGSRVVYVQGLGQALDLYSIAADGTQRVQLDPPATVPSSPRITPDGSRVVFVASGSLYSAPIGGGGTTLLAGPGASADFEISADSASVVAVLESAAFRGLYRVATAGGASPVLLNGPATAGRGVALGGQKLALSGTRAVYRQDRDRDEVFELYSAPLDGSQPEVRISARLDAGRDVQTYRLSADGLHALYLADQTLDETLELFRAPLDGTSTPLRLNTPFAGGPVVGDVLAFDAGPDEGRVVYRADQDSDEVFELYSARGLAPGGGRGEVKRISASLSFFSDVLPTFARSPSGEHVVYATYGFDVYGFLFATRSDGVGDPSVLDTDLYQLPAPYLVSADETRVLYRKELFFGNRFGLFSQRLDGAGAPVHLNPGGITESSVASDFRLTPAGERVVYRVDQSVDAAFELFSVPTDGSGPPVRLNAALPPYGSVQDFALVPDGSRVVYRAGQAGPTRLELFVVPVAGGRPPVRLHPPLTGNLDVSDYAVSSDGRRVVLRGDLEIDQQSELFSVSIHGPSPPVAGLGGSVRASFVRLTQLATGEDVQADFSLHPDGELAFFRAGSTTGALDLFRVPLDGSAPPERLNAALVAGGRVLDFALSPDGARLVYRADQRVNEVFELFSVPLAGGPVVALDSLPASGDVSSFRIAPDSKFAVYLADRNADEAFELFAVPLDGSAPPRRLSNPPATGGDVQSDYSALSDGRALFRADQADEVFELFIGSYEHGPLQAPPP